MGNLKRKRRMQKTFNLPTFAVHWITVHISTTKISSETATTCKHLPFEYSFTFVAWWFCKQYMLNERFEVSGEKDTVLKRFKLRIPLIPWSYLCIASNHLEFQIRNACHEASHNNTYQLGAPVLLSWSLEWLYPWDYISEVYCIVKCMYSLRSS